MTPTVTAPSPGKSPNFWRGAGFHACSARGAVITIARGFDASVILDVRPTAEDSLSFLVTLTCAEAIEYGEAIARRGDPKITRNVGPIGAEIRGNRDGVACATARVDKDTVSIGVTNIDGAMCVALVSFGDARFVGRALIHYGRSARIEGM